MITIIGRGHSGTRIPAKMLHNSGVYMGRKLNQSSDFIPPHKMYDAAKYINSFVKYKGNYKWDFSYLLKHYPDRGFLNLLDAYMKDIVENPSPNKGWKLPETTFIFPWLVKLYPDMKYIIWCRHPYDSILGQHLTDDLNLWNIPFDRSVSVNIKLKRAISWKYQYDVIKATPEPKNVTHMKYEDFVQHPKKCTKELEDFLGIPLKTPKTKTNYQKNNVPGTCF